MLVLYTLVSGEGIFFFTPLFGTEPVYFALLIFPDQIPTNCYIAVADLTSVDVWIDTEIVIPSILDLSAMKSTPKSK